MPAATLFIAKRNGILSATAMIVALTVGSQIQAQSQEPSAPPARPESTAAANVSASQPDDDLPWPRTFIRTTTIDKEPVEQRVIVYQPQVDSWRNYRDISFRCALAVHRAPDVEPVYGVAEVNGRTTVDSETRRVVIESPEIKYRFPNIDVATADECAQLAEEVLPERHEIETSLDLLLAYMDLSATQQREVQVSLDPPPIYYSKRPAIILNFLGDPEFKPIESLPLMYAVNANWDVIVHPESSTSYLLYGDTWLKTRDLHKGPWEKARDLPAEFSELPNDPQWGDVRANIPGQPLDTMPQVFMSRTPAELIVTDGNPIYQTLPGLRLRAVKNTDATLFRHTGDLNFYYLAAGRWFRAAALEGPWSAATTDLPVEFKQVPLDSDWAYVRASVPGTDEANDAIMLASIPRRATVRKDEVSLSVMYDGTPRFAAIADTTIEGATNTASRVFRCESKYYCCKDAIWFQSDAATGPWAVCTKVPDAIYKIPPSHPYHNVTYASVIASTDEWVDVDYTSGYDNALVTAGVLVLGAGVIAAVIAADDVQWNVRVNLGGNTISSYGSGAFYDPGVGAFCRGGRGYGPYAGRGGGAAWNPANNSWARRGYASGGSGGHISTGGGGFSMSISTFGAPLGGANRYSSWNRGVESRDGTGLASNRTSNVRGNAGWYADARDANLGGRARGGDGDLYAGRDGGIYRRDSNGNWQQRKGDGWQGANSRDTLGAGQRSLDADALARGRGIAADNRASSLSGRGRGGGSRGGGGGGGRRGR